MKNYIFLLFILVNRFAIEAQTKMLLRLQVYGSGMQNETVVYFDSSATYSYNSLLDAPSLGVDPGYLNVVTSFDNIDYQVKALPSLIHGEVIPLKVTTGSSGQYHIHASDLQNLPSGACVMLHDNYSGTSHDLRAGDYSCVISDTESVARFSVNINISVLPVPGSVVDNPSCATSLNGKIVALSPGPGLWNYYWKDSLNNIIRTQLNRADNDTLMSISAGKYHVDVSEAGTCSNAAASFSLKGVLSPKAYFTADSVSVVHSSVQFSNSSMNAGSYYWDFGDGMASTSVNAWHNYSSSSVYTVALSAYSSVCNETSTYTKILTVLGTTGLATNTSDNSVWISRDAQGYYVQWNSKIATRAAISAYDLAGRNLLNLTAESALDSKIYLDLAPLKNAVVLLNVILGNEMISKKIVVE